MNKNAFPKLLTVPKNASGKRPDTSPVVSRAASQQRGQLAKGNQALQVPAVALYPSRKKVPVKDLPPFGMEKDLFDNQNLIFIVF